MTVVSYDLAGAADACGLSLREVQRAIRRGDLPVHYSGRKPLILASDLTDYIESLPTERAS